MVRSKGGQLTILVVLAVSTGHARGGESGPALLSANGTCNGELTPPQYSNARLSLYSRKTTMGKLRLPRMVL